MLTDFEGSDVAVAEGDVTGAAVVDAAAVDEVDEADSKQYISIGDLLIGPFH